MKKALIFDTYDDYNIRIQYIQSAFERNGYETMIYFADFDHVKKEYYTNKRSNVHYLHANAYKKNLSYERMHSHALFAKACVEEAQKHTDVSAIYVMVPPNSMVKEFGKYKESHPNVKMWFDVLDMWPESLPISNTLKSLASPILNLWRNVRNDSLHEADIVTTECDLFKKELHGFIDASKMHTVYLAQPNRVLDTFDSMEDTIHFLYCGSINHIVDIDLIVSFLKSVNEKKNVFLDIIGTGENGDAFLDELKKNDIPFTYHGIVYEEKIKEEIYAHCHFGLNIMKETVFVGLTMKSLDYLSHGLPIINTIQGDTKQIVDQYKIGINIDRKDMQKSIDTLLSMHDKNYHDMRKTTKEVFLKYFDEDVVNKQFDEIIKRLENEYEYIRCDGCL